MQHIYHKIYSERCSMSEALKIRLSEDHDKLLNICSQLETQMGSLSQKLDAKLQNTQEKVEELDSAIPSIIEASKVAVPKFELGSNVWMIIYRRGLIDKRGPYSQLLRPHIRKS